jgi:hypothetical protein
VDVDENVQRRLQVADDFSSSDSDNDDDDSDENETTDDESDMLGSASMPSTLKVNLDVSTLICLVSELTHGGHVYRYPSKWLEVTAEMERASRLVPKLENYMQGLSSLFYHSMSNGIALF